MLLLRQLTARSNGGMALALLLLLATPFVWRLPLRDFPLGPKSLLLLPAAIGPIAPLLVSLNRYN